MAHNDMSGLFEKTLSGLKGIADVNTVVGEPIITADGTTVIPVSRVCVGYGVGGWDSNDRNLPKEEKNGFAGGSGGGTTIQPLGFLVISDGDVKMINVNEVSPFEKIVDTMPDILESLGKLIKK